MNKTSRKPKNHLLLSLIATGLAIGVHAYLTQHYYELKFGAVAGQSLCNVNELLNCDAVSVSRFASLFGIPLAMWGLMTNAVLFYFIGVSHLNLVEDKDKTLRYTLMLSGITALASIVMGAISLTLMSNICIFCIAAYLLSFIGFWGIFKSTPDITSQNLLADLKDVVTSERWVAGFLVAIPAFTFLGNAMYSHSKGYGEIEKMTQEKVAYWQVAPVQNFDLSLGLTAPEQPRDNVKMTIVEFADFRCPHCKYAAPTLHAFLKNHPDVQLIFKPFPLDGTCNEAIKGGGDGISCGLASAVMCSEKIAKKGWAAHDYIFENQSEITQAHSLEKNIEGLASHLGLNKDQINSCIKDPSTLELIRKMAKEGEIAQIQGTPSVFVNGKLLGAGQLLPVLESVYRSLQ